MLLVYKKGVVYKLDDTLPLQQIFKEGDLANGESVNFSDFQWCAYKEDFEKWLKKNPREWQAESAQSRDYSKLYESQEESQDEIVQEEKTPNLLSFSEYHESKIFEDDGSPGVNESNFLKLAYAYNKLIDKGKIKETIDFSKETDDLAVFLAIRDDDGVVNEQYTYAYKMSPAKTGGDKLQLVNFTYSMPDGRPVGENEDLLKVIQDQISALAQSIENGTLGKLGISALTVYGLAKAGKLLGGWILGWRGLRYLKKIANKGQGPRQAVKGIRWVRGLWGGIVDGFLFRTPRKLIWNSTKIFKAARFTKTGRIRSGLRFAKFLSREIGGAIEASKIAKYGSKAVKATGLGTKILGGAAEAATGVGALILLADVGISTWSWFSDKQAPTYNDLKGTPGIMDHFNPKEIAYNRPLTVCYSQGDESPGGMLKGFFFTDDTRTTFEITKILETSGGHSIFILNQVNSKSMRKILSEHGVVLLCFPPNTNAKLGYLDNDDLDPVIITLDSTQSLDSSHVFRGFCKWSEFMSAFQSSDNDLLKTDPKAPATFDFNGKDTEGNAINVWGTLYPKDALAKLTEEQIKIIFGLVKADGASAVRESFDNTYEDHSISDDGEIMGFKKFHNRIQGILESDEGDQEDQTPPQNPDVILKPGDMTGAASVAPYMVTKKEYADPKYRNKPGYGTGQFEFFLLSPEIYNVPDEFPIKLNYDLFLNTEEILYDCEAGIKSEADVRGISYDMSPSRPEGNGPFYEPIDMSPVEVLPPDQGDLGEPVPKKASSQDVTIKALKNRTVIKDSPKNSSMNIIDEFMTTANKNILGISTWKNITTAKELRDSSGRIRKIVLKNSEADFGDRRRIFIPEDGEQFEIAKDFIKDARDKIKFE